MECIHCKGRMVRGVAPFSTDRKGYHVAWDAVPAWICHQCGEPYFEAREDANIFVYYFTAASGSCRRLLGPAGTPASAGTRAASSPISCTALQSSAASSSRLASLATGSRRGCWRPLPRLVSAPVASSVRRPCPATLRRAWRGRPSRRAGSLAASWLPTRQS